MDTRAILAWNLRQLRVERGLAQERLAADSGVARTYMSAIERRRVAATIDVLERLAMALDVPVARLLTLPPLGQAAPENLPKGRKAG